mgnify:FL=1
MKNRRKFTMKRMSIKNVSVRNKLRLGFFALIVVFLISSAYTVFSLYSVNDLLDQQAQMIDQVDQIMELSAVIHKKGISVRDFVITEESTYVLQSTDYSKAAHEIIAALGETIYDVEGLEDQAAYLDQIKALTDQYDTIVNHMTMAVDFGDSISMSDYQKLNVLLDEIIASGQGLKELFEAERDQAHNDTLAYVATTQYTNFVLLIVSAILGIVLATLISSAIAKPLEGMVRFSDEIASGNLTVKDLTLGNDELGKLGLSLSKMKTELTRVIGAIINTTKDVEIYSEELAASSNEVSASIEEVASTTNQFASTTEEISGRANQMSSFANEVSTKASSSIDFLEKAVSQISETEAVVVELTKTVEQLGVRSSEISRILDMINEVADQTNLLALNAAIEAARAGEHGRGFAVVADEVRKLAEQTGRATVEIAELITGIQQDTNLAVVRTASGAKQLQDGTQQLNVAQSNIQEMEQLILELIDQIQEITAATTEISSGSQNIASATEEQSATLEEISNTSEQLKTIAGKLSDVVSLFQIGE